MDRNVFTMLSACALCTPGKSRLLTEFPANGRTSSFSALLMGEFCLKHSDTASQSLSLSQHESAQQSDVVQVDSLETERRLLLLADGAQLGSDSEHWPEHTSSLSDMASQSLSPSQHESEAVHGS